jgi:hypothetical protein
VVYHPNYCFLIVIGIKGLEEILVQWLKSLSCVTWQAENSNIMKVLLAPAAQMYCNEKYDHQE